MRRIYTFQKEREVTDEHADMLDLPYSREQMAPYAVLGDAAIPELGNYPFYSGENSAVWAFKPE